MIIQALRISINWIGLLKAHFNCVNQWKFKHLHIFIPFTQTRPAQIFRKYFGLHSSPPMVTSVVVAQRAKNLRRMRKKLKLTAKLIMESICCCCCCSCWSHNSFMFALVFCWPANNFEFLCSLPLAFAYLNLSNFYVIICN